MQKNQHLIGGGVNRTFLFLLINAHVVFVVLLLYLITRQGIKLFLERRKGVPGSVFKQNLLFAFILFSVIPSFFIFFTAGKFITKSIDRWFQAHVGQGLACGNTLHQHHTAVLRSTIAQDGQKLVRVLIKLQNSGLDHIRTVLTNYAVQHWGDQYAVYLIRANELGSKQLLRNEVAVWRTFRTQNDCSMQSLRTAFVGRIRGMTEEASTFDFYGSLYWVKKVDASWLILAYRYPAPIRAALIRLEGAQTVYGQLLSMRSSMYVNYFLTFALITLLILFLSLWCAFYLARGISKPIHELLNATDKVRQGRWDTTVTVNPSSDLQQLARGFNEMTAAVRQAHLQLEEKNAQDLVEIVKINKIKTWQEAARQMAHEIKNPLTPIQLATQRLQRRWKNAQQDDPIFFDCTNTILQQVTIIKDLVSHFAEFASLPSLHIQPTDLPGLIREVFCLYQVSYPEIAFVQNFYSPQTVIDTDQKKMKLVLINLLDNSIRALKQGKAGSGGGVLHDAEPGCITCTVTQAGSGNNIEILFADNGPGIPQLVRDTLFLPYVSTEKKNMGLGLAIVHDIISSLGGSIDLARADIGASFVIKLPAARNVQQYQVKEKN